MEKAYVLDKDGCFLVKGSLNGCAYDGHGKPYAFSKTIASLLCECFGYTQQPAEGTEQLPQPDYVLRMDNGRSI